MNDVSKNEHYFANCKPGGTILPKKQYYTTDESAGESGRTTAVQSEDVS